MVSGKAKRGSYLAFGPFLCAGVVCAFWFGERLLYIFYL